MKKNTEMLPEAPTLYQIAPDKSMLLNCYLIKTCHGKYILIDGGGAGSSANSGYLYNKLVEITGEKEPEIEAWFFSHMHDDHVTEFSLMAKNEKAKIKVNNVYFNFPSREFMKSSEDGQFAYLYNGMQMAYDKHMGQGAFEKTNSKTAFEGDVFDIDGVKIEILMTVTDAETESNINDTSMIFRATIEGQTILFLGDAYFHEGDRLARKFGKDLKSDFVQMAHHGQNGVNRHVYEQVDPTACLWPTPIWVYENPKGIYQTTEVRQWMTDLGVKYHFVAGVSLTQSFTFPVDFSTIEEFSVAP